MNANELSHITEESKVESNTDRDLDNIEMDNSYQQFLETQDYK